MRKIILVAFFAILFLTTYAQDKKVAIISVFVDKNLTGDMGEVLLQKLNKDKNFNFDSLANDFRDKLFEKYVSELPIELIPEEKVITVEGYKDLKTGSEESIWDLRMQPASGYVFIDARTGLSGSNVKNIRKSFELIPEADLVMVCYVDFGLGAGTGGGLVSGNKISAYANFKILDKNGKKVIVIREYAQSKHMMVTGLGGTAYDPDKLKELSNEALEALYKDLDKKLEKNYKKVQKKLSKLK